MIDDSFNASIMEESRYAGLFEQHVTMTVGLPLLIVLDERAIRAVIAHEIAHTRLKHTSGSTNLYDFVAASENVLYYADPDRTITGRVAHALLHSLVEWLSAEYRALSRENELCADGDAAEQVGREEMARALVLTEGGGARLTELVMKPLEKEMLGAIKAPTSPLQRILSQLEDIRASELRLLRAQASRANRIPHRHIPHSASGWPISVSLTFSRSARWRRLPSPSFSPGKPPANFSHASTTNGAKKCGSGSAPVGEEDRLHPHLIAEGMRPNPDLR